jgi:hypothetical protein
MAVFTGSTIIREGLVLHLDAANPRSYSGGTVWKDLSGKSNNATLYNSPTFSDGRAFFNGTDEYAEIPYDADNFTFSLEQTIFIILSPTDNDGLRRNPYNQSYGASGTWTHETNGGINFYYGTGSVTGEAGSPYTSIQSAAISQNETAIMTTARSASNNFRRWYKNGVRTFNGTVVYNPVTNSTNVIRIGRGYAGYYMGFIDCVLVYNIALTDEQIKQNFEALRSRYGV